MAKIKSLRLKEKRYIFNVMKNREQAAPMACVFSRFPLPDEDFPYAQPLEISDEIARAVAESENRDAAIKTMLRVISPTIMENVKRQRIDYKKFVKECIERFEDVEYEGRKIETVEEFSALPYELFYILARDAYIYAFEKDLFEFEEKNELAKR
jgi:hypothetical protein